MRMFDNEPLDFVPDHCICGSKDTYHTGECCLHKSQVFEGGVDIGGKKIGLAYTKCKGCMK